MIAVFKKKQYRDVEIIHYLIKLLSKSQWTYAKHAIKELEGLEMRVILRRLDPLNNRFAVLDLLFLAMLIEKHKGVIVDETGQVDSALESQQR
jgi:hypothetical protein